MDCCPFVYWFVVVSCPATAKTVQYKTVELGISICHFFTVFFVIYCITCSSIIHSVLAPRAKMASSSVSDPPAAAEDSEAAVRRRELELSIEDRVKAVTLEHERLLSLGQQVRSMEVVNAKGIEQLRAELQRVSQELGSESARLRAADATLATATATLQAQQEAKRALSESLMELLLESEGAGTLRLQAVEDELARISAPPAAPPAESG